MPLTVLLDLDGTLVDSNYHHAMAWHEALLDQGYDVPVVDIQRRVGMGGGQMLDELIGEADEAVEKAWRANFEAQLDRVQPIDGAHDLVEALYERGHTLVLATSSPEDLFEALVAKVGIDQYMTAHVTADDVDEAKPEPDVFQAALDKVGATAEASIVVGDATWDVKAAQRAGLRCVCVQTGGYGRAELEAAGAVAVYRDPRDLLAQLDASPLA